MTQPLIAVAGAASKQGRSVVDSLLADGGFRVRALTRSPQSELAQSWVKRGAEVVSSDDLAAAFHGAHGVFLMTPPTPPNDSQEYATGCLMADAAVAAGVRHIVFSTLENVDERTKGTKFAPHFTDKARIADYIRRLPVQSSFVMIAFFFTNLMEYYLPRWENDKLLIPIYLPEDFRAPFADPLSITGPAVLDIFKRPQDYDGVTVPLVGDWISPREMVETFTRLTGIPAEYRNAYTREGLLHHFPEFAANELLVQELLGMVQYAVEYGYFSPTNRPEHITPNALNWEAFLQRTGWKGEKAKF